MSSVSFKQIAVLYRRLLRLHERLPPEFASVGSQFIREEFRRHKDAEKKFVPKFFKEWTEFADLLEAQISADEKLGKNLSKNELNLLSKEQSEQLNELHTETKKPPV